MIIYPLPHDTCTCSIAAYRRICTHAAFSALGLLPLHISPLADNTYKAMYNIHIITSHYYKGICHIPPPGEVQTSKYLHARHNWRDVHCQSYIYSSNHEVLHVKLYTACIRSTDYAIQKM